MRDTLYTWGTPNGLKPILMLEELAADYELVKVHIGKGEQKTPEFLGRNLNGRIPVLDTTIDGTRVSIAESAAILVHLAEREGRFLPTKPAPRARAMQWVMFQMSAVGPMFGQAGFFLRQRERNEGAIERYVNETKRILGVLDTQLGQHAHLAGDEYTIADMLTLFWTRKPEYFGLTLEEWPNLRRWIAQLEERPAVQRTLAITFP
ncbi:glutathione S-transferase family protein [Sandaracinus amylolyticus]|uniref:glutathione S-transferase family protein n=1 Tax=Sandaracinus amylolyticus TaxID=927083 RepID=UPI001F2F9DA1|nr:glutathione binding-like protein [Sandaracinus amylolyticus]UJR79313.1 Glutathione S-transferase domain [Sandaracinus amylolyticus]